MSKFIILSVLIVGCAAQAQPDPIEPQPIKAADNSPYFGEGQDQGIPCPSPLTFTVIVDGKEVEKTYYPPCHSDNGYRKPISDDPWNEDGSKSHSVIPSPVPVPEPIPEPR